MPAPQQTPDKAKYLGFTLSKTGGGLFDVTDPAGALIGEGKTLDETFWLCDREVAARKGDKTHYHCCACPECTTEEDA